MVTKSVKIITKDALKGGLYKYTPENVVVVENRSNIEEGRLKTEPNHDIGVRMARSGYSDRGSIVLGQDFATTNTSYRYAVTNVTYLYNWSGTDYRQLNKGGEYSNSVLTTGLCYRLPRYVDACSFTDLSANLANYGYSGLSNIIQQDACKFFHSFIFGNTFVSTTKSITVPISTSVNLAAAGKGYPFCGITYVGELNDGEKLSTVVDRMQTSNKTLYHGSLSSEPSYYPEYLPFILIATNKKVDLTTGEEVTFEKFTQIPDAVFEEPSSITDRWHKLRGFPTEVSLKNHNIGTTMYSQLRHQADDNGKVHLYGLMLGYGHTVDMVGYVQNYIQIASNSYINEAKSNVTRIGSANTTDTYLRGTVHSNGSFVTDSDERIKRKDQLITTRADGIEIWKFTYHSNGKTEIGWIAQQVEEVLRAKSYGQDVIDLVITTDRGVDYNASLAKLNTAMGTSYDLFVDAEKAHADWLYGKFTEAGGSEATLEEFREAIKNIPYESLTEWQKSTTQMLDENSLETFLVWVDDIKAINKQIALDLLGGA
nr:MAG: hypothetical protein [Enquatrovirus sp.]